VPEIAPAGDQPHRHRRRRRRRRRPRVDAAAASGSTAPAEGPALTAQEAPSQAAATEKPTATTTEQGAPTQPPTGDAPRKRRRRRRRRRPRPEGLGLAATTGQPTSGESGEAVQVPAATEREEPRPDEAPRHPEQQHRTPRKERWRDREKRIEKSRDPRAGEDRGARTRDARGPRDKRGARGPKDRRHERGRDDFRKKPEPKPYRLESIVDRGFEDVADPETDGGSRRVDWTILKRTTADQRTTQTLSVIYVLRRDGIETEYPHLGAARAVVNKTISHPEKLTLSKADHAAARGGGKK
jgi:hypothetical protein